MPARSRPQRHADDLAAAQVLDRHLPTLLDLVEAVVRDVDPGQGACAQLVRDARIAAEVAARLDDAIPLPEPLETWDRPILFLVALGALGIYRASRRAAASRRDKLARKLAPDHLSAARSRV